MQKHSCTWRDYSIQLPFSITVRIMSDLAPFVAAVLRDRTVEEMKQEIDDLRAELSRTRKVSVTGPFDSPVYAEGQLENGRLAGLAGPDYPRLWRVDLGALAVCSVAAFQGIEVRVGGICVAKFQDNDAYECRAISYSHETRVVLIQCRFYGPSSLKFTVLVKPVSHEDYDRLEQEYASILHGLNDQFGENQEITVTFQSIEFANRTVLGALQNLGIENIPC